MNRTPLILAIVLLLLPVLYVGSYFAMVTPRSLERSVNDFLANRKPTAYRFGSDWSERIFWPLEQIDRKVRPEAWESIVISPRIHYWEPGLTSPAN